MNFLKVRSHHLLKIQCDEKLSSSALRYMDHLFCLKNTFRSRLELRPIESELDPSSDLLEFLFNVCFNYECTLGLVSYE